MHSPWGSSLFLLTSHQLPRFLLWTGCACVGIQCFPLYHTTEKMTLKAMNHLREMQYYRDILHCNNQSKRVNMPMPESRIVSSKNQWYYCTLSICQCFLYSNEFMQYWFNLYCVTEHNPVRLYEQNSPSFLHGYISNAFVHFCHLLSSFIFFHICGFSRCKPGDRHYLWLKQDQMPKNEIILLWKL